MREIIMVAFTKAGGCDYLVKQSKEEPKAFMALLGRVVPQEVSVHLGGGIDLGEAMRIAQDRVARLNAPKDITPAAHATLEHEATPRAKVAHVKVARAKVAHVKVVGDNMVDGSEKVRRVSRKKRTVERGKKK
tara:strand:+ start:917 stop:1315 length:399 start_codon:yes stop_codon:yes gene_type:complete